MRCNHTTTVNVLVNDRLDRTNVVARLQVILRHLHLIARGFCPALAKQYGEQKWRLQAMSMAAAGSPSWAAIAPPASLAPRTS